MHRSFHRRLPPGAALLLATLAGCGGGADGESAEGRPNVVLVTIDSLRADRLGCYGYARETTPNLDGFADEAVRFERAYTHAPFTAPSHASLFTSLHTQSHGVLAWEESIEPKARTYGERYREAGYRTAAFYNHPGLRRSGVTRGFDQVWLKYFGPEQATTEAFLEWLDGGAGPFAVWLHYWDVHRPYAYRNWDQEWMANDPELRVDAGELIYGEQRFGRGDALIGRSEAYYNLHAEKRAQPKPTSDGSRVLTADDLRYVSDRYDGGVAHADAGVRRLLAGLRARGLYDDTVIAITADHGESLTEREACYFTHDPFLYEETLHVPLLLKLPGGAHAGRVVPELVREIDVLPTILELTDLALRPEDQGRSMMALVRGEPDEPRLLFAATQSKSYKERAGKLELLKPGEEPGDKPGARYLPAAEYAQTWLEHREALTDGRHKLIYDHDDQAWSFFDLATDPGELHDLSQDPAQREAFEAWRQRLQTFRRTLPVSGSEWRALTAEDAGMLEGLGYAGDVGEH